MVYKQKEVEVSLLTYEMIIYISDDKIPLGKSGSL